MSYDSGFYRAYSKYLMEPKVRAAHRRGVAMLTNPVRVVDLGCGQNQEYRNLAKPSYYAGIDLNVEAYKSRDGRKVLVRGNYRDYGFMQSFLDPAFRVDTFVSLFSSEITHLPTFNYSLYRNIFSRASKMRQGLVAGFYYADRKYMNPINEAGGVLSYQTLENPEDVAVNEFREIRLTMHVPSKMFGPSVYEVWKLFTRKL